MSDSYSDFGESPYVEGGKWYETWPTKASGTFYTKMNAWIGIAVVFVIAVIMLLFPTYASKDAETIKKYNKYSSILFIVGGCASLAYLWQDDFTTLP